MFELPEAKRVRREDLYSPASSPRSSPDAELTDLLRARLQEGFEIVTAQPSVEAPAGSKDDGAASEDEGLEFRLFAAPAAGSATVPAQKVRVRSPSPEDHEPGFVDPNRPQNYYFTGEIPSGKRRELESIAVSGDEVLRRAKEMRWPGCAMPWKVRTIPPVGKMVRSAACVSVGAMDVATEKRRKKGKKARIAMRKKLRSETEKKEAQARLLREKEEAERAKRTQKNREKKIKKRERDKVKKAAEQNGDGGGGAEDVVMEGA